MKIAVIQIYNNNIKEYAEYSRMINSIYALKHGYEYISWDYDLVPLEYSVYYNKIAAIYQTIKSDINFEWVLYLDADAIITNQSIKLEDIIAKYQDKEIIMAQDLNGKNNGVILIKNTPIMADYLQDCYTNRNFFHSKTPEQAAMFVIVEQDKYKEKIGWETMQFFNAYLFKYKNMEYDEPLWDNTSFILHLQRLPNDKRIKIFKEYLERMHIHCITKESN